MSLETTGCRWKEREKCSCRVTWLLSMRHPCWYQEQINDRQRMKNAGKHVPGSAGNKRRGHATTQTN